MLGRQEIVPKGRHTPMYYPALCLIGGILLFNLFSPSLSIVVAINFTTLLLFILWQQRIIVYTFLLSLGLLTTALNVHHSPQLTEQNDVTLLLDVGKHRAAHVAAIKESESTWRSCHHKVIAYNSEGYALQRIVVKGNVTPIDPSQSKYHYNIYHSGYRNIVVIKEILSQGSAQDNTLANRFNEWAQQKINKLGLSKQTAATVSAMVLGRREGLDRSIIDDYSRSGIMHLLALSGMHLGILLLLVIPLTYLFPLMRYGHIVADLVAILVVWIFAMMVGFSDSVLRAAWMYTILKFSLATSKRYSSLNSLFIAAFIMLIFDPNALFSASFQLSFAATCGIIIICPKIARQINGENIYLNYIVNSLIVSFIAMVTTLPLVGYYFGYFNIYSPLITLLIIFPLMLIILTTILWILCPFEILSPLLGHIIEVVVTLQNHLVAWFAKLDSGLIEVEINEVWVVVLYTIILGSMAIVSRWLDELNSRTA